MQTGPFPAIRLQTAKQARFVVLCLPVILYALLDPAFKSVGRHAAAQPGSGGSRNTQTETPGGPVFGQWASEIGVVFEVPSDDSLTIFGVSC